MRMRGDTGPRRLRLLEVLPNLTGRVVRDHALAVILVTLVATAGFGAAILTMPSHPSSEAFESDTEVMRAMERIDTYLPPRGHLVPFLVENTAHGNVLSRDTFDEILAREDAIRADPAAAPLVYAYSDPNLRMEVSSVWSLPDTLRAMMNGETPLAFATGWHASTGGPGVGYDEATDAEWQDALDRLLTFRADDGSQPFLRPVSKDARVVNGEWRARSMFVTGSFDNALLFERYAEDPADATPDRPFFETFTLHVRDVARADAEDTAWYGVGIGINTQMEKEIAESSRLVAGAFVVIGIVLYVTLRNWRDFLVAYASLPILITWMVGGARILGLSNNQFTAMLPVLILALGVDYAIHGVRRYREERAEHAPDAAVGRSVSFLGPTLLLTCATTATAFLSNAFSGVPALRDWGIMGGIAIASALWLCGAFTPALSYAWDQRRVRRGRLEATPRASVTATRLREGTFLGRLALWTSARPVAVFTAVVLVTVPAAWLAVGLESDFDARDFFDDDSELLTTLARVEEDYPNEGEYATLLVEGDVADPEVLKALSDGLSALREYGYAPEAGYSLPAVVRTFQEYPEENGASYEDRDADGLPDRAADVRDLLDRALRDGVYARAEAPPQPVVPGTPLPPAPPPVGGPGEARVLAYNPETVRELVHPTEDGGFNMTLAYVGVPNTDDFRVIPKATADAEDAAADLHALQGSKVERITLTGEPFQRYEMVNAVTDSLKVSLSISLVLCFLILLAAFREPRYAFATMLPVVLLVPWLYGFMRVAGLSLNLVTVTIAAMSIGVGVDYSLHIANRFREESRRGGHPPLEALRRTMDSAGLALLGTTSSTVLGFLVLLLAPMPLFQTFGFLTAGMIAASFLTAGTVLPPLLIALERRGARRVPVKPRETYSPAVTEHP